MKKVLIMLCFMLFTLGCSATPEISTNSLDVEVSLNLTKPELTGDISLEETLYKRRSVREYSGKSLSLAEVSQLLWAGQGITADWGGRTAPSAGGLYPLEIYIITGQVDDLIPGIYKYVPERHGLIKISEGDARNDLAAASLNQEWVEEGALNIVIAGVFERTTAKYGERGRNYVYMEAGHVAQNICLQATALDLGAVTVGAFEDDTVKNVIDMPDNETPLYVIPVGNIK